MFAGFSLPMLRCSEGAGELENYCGPSQLGFNKPWGEARLLINTHRYSRTRLVGKRFMGVA